jgi:GMP synthase (glutamine-hydrolysing)
MHIHYFQHLPFEGLANIATWTEMRGHTVTGTRLFAGETLPDHFDYDWLVVMGGLMCVRDVDEYAWFGPEMQYIDRAIAKGRTVVGVCLGAQILAHVMDAPVYRNTHKEIGWFDVELTDDAQHSAAFSRLPARFPAFHWHGDTFDIPQGAVHLARSQATPHQAFEYDQRVFALQFHLESDASSIAALVRECADEMTPGPYVQSDADIAAANGHVPEMHQLMVQLLDGIAALRAE